MELKVFKTCNTIDISFENVKYTDTSERGRSPLLMVS